MKAVTCTRSFLKLQVFFQWVIVPPCLFYYSNGAASFNHTYLEDPYYVVKEGTARFNWSYSVNNRMAEFRKLSPVWYFKNKAVIIGRDNGFDKTWTFRIDTTNCPSRLLNPIRVSREDQATLVIKDVTTADSGVYGCFLALYNVAAKDYPTDTVKLIVTETPTFTVRPNPITTVVENTPLDISCTAVGPPQPNITWVEVLSGNTEVEGKGTAVLRKNSIERDKNGTLFKCLATNNPHQNPMEAKTTIVVYYPPEFTRSPVNTTVTEDGYIILHCQATANPPDIISWTRENNIAIQAGFKIFGNGTLLIPKANKTDVGKYICTAKNVFNSKTHTQTTTAIVTVKYEPSIVDKSKNLIVKEGDPVKLKCKADSFPAPTITWSKSPSPIRTPNTGEWYNISSVKRSDAGTYTCTASNGIGNDATDDIKVTVQFKPTIDKDASNTTGTSWNGHSITLRCILSSANPAPTWTWYKPDGSNITYEARNIDKGSEVKIKTGKDDYGSYRCEANNVAGSDVHQIKVTQLFPPGPPNVTVTAIEASTVTVCWTNPAYDGGSPVTGYKLEIGSRTNEFGESKMEYTVSGLTKDTKYVVKLYAKNIVGNGEAATTTFTTKKQGPPVQPSIESDVVNQTSVVLTWLKPEENGGEIKNYTVYQKDQDITWKSVVHIYATTKQLTYTIKNLERGKIYHFKVSATNIFGESAKDDSKAKSVKIQDATIPPTTLANGGPSKGQSSGGDDPNQTIIIVGVVVAVILILITAVISIVILRKKNIFGQGTRKSGRNESAAYHNDVDTNDSLGRQAAVNLNGNDDIPTYAAVDMSKKTKKKANDIPTYAVVDKSKKKRPGEIIYAELADFNTNNTATAPRPDQYAVTDYADISQFQQQSEPEPTYANFQGRSKDYANVEDMSSQA